MKNVLLKNNFHQLSKHVWEKTVKNNPISLIVENTDNEFVLKIKNDSNIVTICKNDNDKVAIDKICALHYAIFGFMMLESVNDLTELQ
jgi:hypothetical protein